MIMFDFITPENAPWILTAFLLVGLVCVVRIALACCRGELFKKDHWRD